MRQTWVGALLALAGRDRNRLKINIPGPRAQASTRAIAMKPVILVIAVTLYIASPAAAQTDFSGEWSVRNHEDCLTNSCQPPLGNYLGTPLNDAGRQQADK